MNENIRLFQRIALRIGTVGLAMFIPFSYYINNLPYFFQLIPFFISMVFLGLPHGAMDHLVPSKLASYTRRKSIYSVSALYLVIGGLYIFLWILNPTVSLAFFILITWFHWGQGDVYVLSKFSICSRLNSNPDKVISLLVRGGIPMLVPLVYHIETYTRFLTSVLSLFSVEPVVVQNLMISTASTGALAVIGSLVVLNLLVGAYRSISTRQWKLVVYDNAEVLLLWLFFMSLNPLFAVGIYFCLWHSVRHLARLSLIKDQPMTESLMRGDLKTYLGKIGENTFTLTLVSLLMLTGLNKVLNLSFNNPESIVSLYLVFISVLTLPHIIVVTWMDFRQNIW